MPFEFQQYAPNHKYLVTLEIHRDSINLRSKDLKGEQIAFELFWTREPEQLAEIIEALQKRLRTRLNQIAKTTAKALEK